MNPDYKLYHPKWHRRRIPIFWWLQRLAYTKFIFRELTSLGVLYAAILILVQVWALSQGEAFYEQWLAWLSWRPVLALHALVFLALIFHLVTWFSLAPKAMVVRLGSWRVPDRVLLLAHYLAWLGATALVFWGLTGR